MKILPLGAEFLHVDGQTDKHMTKIIVDFQYFAKAPKCVVFPKQPHKSNACLLAHAYID
jgi:hypothetical protein